MLVSLPLLVSPVLEDFVPQTWKEKVQEFTIAFVYDSKFCTEHCVFVLFVIMLSPLVSFSLLSMYVCW